MHIPAATDIKVMCEWWQIETGHLPVDPRDNNIGRIMIFMLRSHMIHTLQSTIASLNEYCKIINEHENDETIV